MHLKYDILCQTVTWTYDKNNVWAVRWSSTYGNLLREQLRNKIKEKKRKILVGRIWSLKWDNIRRIEYDLQIVVGVGGGGGEYDNAIQRMKKVELNMVFGGGKWIGKEVQTQNYR